LPFRLRTFSVSGLCVSECECRSFVRLQVCVCVRVYRCMFSFSWQTCLHLPLPPPFRLPSPAPAAGFPPLVPAVKMLKTKGHAGELKFDHTTKELRAFVRRAPPVFVCPRAQGTALSPFSPPSPLRFVCAVARNCVHSALRPSVPLLLQILPNSGGLSQSTQMVYQDVEEDADGKENGDAGKDNANTLSGGERSFSTLVRRGTVGVVAWGPACVPHVPPCRALPSIRPRLFLPMRPPPPPIVCARSQSLLCAIGHVMDAPFR
jgi:hypothetical protein